MGQPVVHFEIIGQDADKLNTFYSSLFDWNINADNPMNYGIVDRKENLNPAGIGIGEGIGVMPGSPSYVTFYVEVPNVEAALSPAESFGGTRMMGPEKVMDGVEIGMFIDPEGHLIGITESESGIHQSALRQECDPEGIVGDRVFHYSYRSA